MSGEEEVCDVHWVGRMMVVEISPGTYMWCPSIQCAFIPCYSPQSCSGAVRFVAFDAVTRALYQRWCRMLRERYREWSGRGYHQPACRHQPTTGVDDAGVPCRACEGSVVDSIGFDGFRHGAVDDEVEGYPFVMHGWKKNPMEIQKRIQGLVQSPEANSRDEDDRADITSCDCG